MKLRHLLMLGACIAIVSSLAIDVYANSYKRKYNPLVKDGFCYIPDYSKEITISSSIVVSGTGQFAISSGGVNITTTTASMDFFGITIDSATTAYLGSLAVQSAKFGAYTPWTYTATKVSAWVDSGTVTGLQLYAYPSLPFSVASSTPLLSSLVNVSTTSVSFTIANPSIPKGSYLIFTTTGTTGSPSELMIPVWGIKQ